PDSGCAEFSQTIGATSVAQRQRRKINALRRRQQAGLPADSACIGLKSVRSRNVHAKGRNPYYKAAWPGARGDQILLTKSPTETPAAAPPPEITAGPPELETGGVLMVDLSAIVFNWRSLMQRAVPADCAAVVKADAYGCGIGPVTAEL